MPKMEECLKPHALLHTVTGVGLGLLLVAVMPSVVENAVMVGVVLVVAGVIGEFVWKK